LELSASSLRCPEQLGVKIKPGKKEGFVPKLQIFLHFRRIRDNFEAIGRNCTMPKATSSCFEVFHNFGEEIIVRRV
jgi:hypothetical protein